MILQYVYIEVACHNHTLNPDTHRSLLVSQPRLDSAQLPLLRLLLLHHHS